MRGEWWTPQSAIRSSAEAMIRSSRPTGRRAWKLGPVAAIVKRSAKSLRHPDRRVHSLRSPIITVGKSVHAGIEMRDDRLGLAPPHQPRQIEMHADDPHRLTS